MEFWAEAAAGAFFFKPKAGDVITIRVIDDGAARDSQFLVMDVQPGTGEGAVVLDLLPDPQN